MRTNTNELNIHLLLSNDIDRLREIGKCQDHHFFCLFNMMFIVKRCRNC